MKKLTVIADFKSPIEKVWEIVTDNSNFKWRSDLSKIVVANDQNCFSEFTKSGFETQFVITAKNPYKRYEFSMKNKNMSGYWIGVFRRNGDSTQIEFTEQVDMSNPVMNLLAGTYIKKQQSTYISDLRKALGE